MLVANTGTYVHEELLEELLEDTSRVLLYMKAISAITMFQFLCGYPH